MSQGAGTDNVTGDTRQATSAVRPGCVRLSDQPVLPVPQRKQSREINSYRDLYIWEEGITLVRKVYAATQNFPDCERYGLVSQMRRAAVSIPANIAEGCSRNYRKEFKQYLYISLGSLSELETLCEVALQVELLPEITVKELHPMMSALRIKILALLKKLNRGPNENK